MDKEKLIIEKAKSQFNKNLLLDNYHRIHSDDNQLERLIKLLSIKKGENYLDLATGNGYIAFELAKLYKDINIYGLDIAEKAIKRNMDFALKNEIRNIKFDEYDGFYIPYKDDFFQGITCRHAIHHFPNIKETAKQIAKLLKKDGEFILADCTIDEIDTDRFVDEYMQLKDDGHVKFYLEEEFMELFIEHGMVVEEIFYSNIRFPRPVDERYYELIKSQKEDIIKAYQIEVIENEIYITLKVMNIKFKKSF